MFVHCDSGFTALTFAQNSLGFCQKGFDVCWWHRLIFLSHRPESAHDKKTREGLLFVFVTLTRHRGRYETARRNPILGFSQEKKEEVTKSANRIQWPSNAVYTFGSRVLTSSNVVNLSGISNLTWVNLWKYTRHCLQPQLLPKCWFYILFSVLLASLERLYAWIRKRRSIFWFFSLCVENNGYIISIEVNIIG